MTTTREVPRHKLLDHRFVIVAGKGGVGKSTVATALALASARAGRRTLLYQYAAAQGRIPLGDREVGESIVEIAPNLHAVRPSTESGMREYVLMRVRSKTAYKLVFENDLVRKLIGGIPAVNELIWLGKAFHHERERDDDGRAVWDTIVLDPPATGHSLYLFQVPFVIREAVSSGPFHRDAVDMVALLQDPERTALHLITLPEEMPVNEVIQLHGELQERMQIPLGSLVANMVFAPLFDDAEEAALGAIRTLVPENGDVIDRLVAAARFRIERRGLQKEYLARLERELRLPIVEIPNYLVPDLGEVELGDIAARFAACDASQERYVGTADLAPQPATASSGSLTAAGAEA